MNRYSWIIICLAYIIGLLATGLFYFYENSFSFNFLLQIGLFFVFVVTIARIFVKSISIKVWLCAIVIGLLAIAWFNYRIPQPASNDISTIITEEKSLIVTVTGKVLTEPRLNSSQKLKFWLQTNKVAIENQVSSQTVTGKIYVTLPLIEGKNIYPQEQIAIKGALYKPRKPNNSFQFNFQKYLKERDTFAGLTGFKIIEQSATSSWGWYRLRQRIIRAQVKGLGSPLGQLISSMVLGRKAVDLPEDIRNLFIKSGLAHVLAASGFHVSLLLGFTLKITQFLRPQKQLIIGSSILLIYSCLTGFSPSVVRAVIMGFAILIATASKAKVRPLGSLLLAATIILLINPLWIWDLGFQLSFLATLGLITALPIIETKLDYLPSNISNLIAIPLAASLWTLPLLSYVFNNIATYSIIVNVITMPLIAVVSLGGMISSAIALIIPELGSYVTWLLKYPLLLLIHIIKLFVNLPGSTFAVGTISLWLLLVLYGLIVLFTFNRKIQNNWWLVLIAIVSLTIIPLRYQQINRVQFTILNTNNSQTLFIEDKGKAILIYKGKQKDIKYAISPFLNSQGINRLDYLIIAEQQDYFSVLSILKSQTSVSKLAIYKEMSTCLTDCQKELAFSHKNNIPVELNPTIMTESVTINLEKQTNTLQVKINDWQWLLTDNLSYLDTIENNQKTILLWFGNTLDYQTIKTFDLKVAVANQIESIPTTPNQSLQLYTTQNNPLITWTAQKGFNTDTEKAKRNNILW